MKKILVIVGCDREKGNTDKLADSFIDGAAESGHGVTKVHLGNKTVNGCKGCNACRYGKPCIIKDDMQEIYPLFHDCHMIVLASPLYFWTITAKTKAFLERLYATAAQDMNPPLGRYEKYERKESVLLMTAADKLFWTFEQALSYYRFSCINYLGWIDRGMVLAGGCGGSPGKRHIEDTGYLEEAYRLGKGI